MSDDFCRPVGMDQQAAVASSLFAQTPALQPDQYENPEAIREYLIAAEGEIRKTFEVSDFRADRLNRHSRSASGLEISKRQYNKRFRLVSRLERKRQRLIRELQKRAFTMIGKSRLASRLTRDEFSNDIESACFIGYYTARCNLRSEFTVIAQQRPYDEIANMLFQRCQRSSTADWYSIAQVYPDRSVLSRLDDLEKGMLLSVWYAILTELAQFLKQLWMANQFNGRTMIVERGNDSTTWNNTASAWNKGRAAWFALLEALDMEDVIERMCPGKVLRLMAADVVAWHRSLGKSLEADTFVWEQLPFPWEVLSGDEVCSRSHVEAVCRVNQVDPVKNGWTVARSGRTIQPFRPTPELVHGVTIGHPGLALILKKLGYFSGKSIKSPSGDA